MSVSVSARRLAWRCRSLRRLRHSWAIERSKSVVASLGMGNSGSELALRLREVAGERPAERASGEIPEADEAEDRRAKCRYAGEASVLENPTMEACWSGYRLATASRKVTSACAVRRWTTWPKTRPLPASRAPRRVQVPCRWYSNSRRRLPSIISARGTAGREPASVFRRCRERSSLWEDTDTDRKRAGPYCG